MKITTYLKLTMFFVLLLYVQNANAVTFTEDFSGTLSNWTAGPSHLDSYGIVGGELFIDGKGHLTGSGGWGVLQFNEELGSSFEASWDARVTYYDYANFVLFAGSPWDFSNSLGYANNGYVGWIDINDPITPLFDVMKMSGGSGLHLPIPQADIPVPEIAGNQWFNYRVVMNSGTLQVFVDGIKYVDTFDPQFSSSNYKIGLSFGEDSEGYIDNFSVTTSPVPEPSTLFLLGSALAGFVVYRRKLSI